ncbi:MAG: ABC transporter ATP-binding protein, partial [Candidatus Bathyarchaeia archaeon]
VALNNVSFEVDKGSFTVVMGPSPCGKTVLLKCIEGLEKPTTGKIYIDGKDMEDVPVYKRDLSLVFQNYALFPHLTVADNIAFGLKMRGVDAAKVSDKVEQVMNLVALEGLESRYPRELSGGQQQRVALARSLIVEPSILLLDEPLGNLDYKLQQKMQVELKMLHEKIGITFIHVTHSREQAMTLADKVIVMNHGIIEQIGSPDDVYRSPSSVFVARFAGEVNTLRGEVETVKGDVARVKTDVGTFEATSNALEKGKQVVYAVRPESVAIGPQAKQYHNTLEANYIEQIYKGSDVMYVVLLRNGREFKVLKQGRKIVDLKARTGDPVLLGWDSGEALLIEKPSAVLGVDVETAMAGA